MDEGFTPMTEEIVGQCIGNYRLVKLLGSGSFANVYLGEHLHLGTYSAIKILHTRLADDEVASFLGEARILARLIHPHIIKVLDFDVNKMLPFLVMTYAPGGTLRQLHPRTTKVPLPTVVGYLRQIGSALEYAHKQRVIHRDVKPENMLIDSQGQLMLSDFGVASIAPSSSSQMLEQIAGTISYAAPEQLQGKPCFASDQYALGIVLYEWLSGERPFQGSAVEIVAQHMTAPLSPLAGRIPGIPPAIENVIFTALAKDPDKRFADMQAFMQAFELAFQGTYSIGDLTPSVIDNQREKLIPPSNPILKHEANTFNSSSSLGTASVANHDSSMPVLVANMNISQASTKLIKAAPEPATVPIPAPLPNEPASLQSAPPQSPALAGSPTIENTSRRNVLMVGGSIFLLLLVIAGSTIYAFAYFGSAMQTKQTKGSINTKGTTDTKTSIQDAGSKIADTTVTAAATIIPTAEATASSTVTTMSIVIPPTPTQTVKILQTVPLYRLLKTGTGNHFYTTSATERDNAVNHLGFKYEGIAGYVFSTQVTGSVPLYRLVLATSTVLDHFYTTSAAERDNAVKTYSYKYEGIQCYVLPTQMRGTTPLYRLVNSKPDHFYTISSTEKDNAVKSYGYKYEGIASYIFATNQS
jgi:serine/threonine protein kinase